MSKIIDTLLSGVGWSLLVAANFFRQFWARRPWRKKQTRWAFMALTDGHGKWRNKRCMCGSGLKFKFCHGATQQQKEYRTAQRELHLDGVRLRNFLAVN